MRKTKIVCTLGPAVDDCKTLTKLFSAGMNVARFNFSHGDYEQQLKRIELFKAVREELNMPIPMMLDTKGPEIRIGTFENDMAILHDGANFTLSQETCVGDFSKVFVNYPHLYEDVSVGTKILINDGIIELKVKEIINKEVLCEVIHGGKLTNRKSVNIPGLSLNLPVLTDKDKDDIIFGIKNGFDIIAASFVRKVDDILAIKEVLKENNASHIKIIAKIENQEGVDNFDKILDNVDGIMVARGDLGVEIPMDKVPLLQKEFVKKCNKKGKTVIVATQMLESMITNPRPTRAEVNDVANAIFDGASTIMLSGEVAAGSFPIESVKTMAQIAETIENGIDYWNKFSRKETSHLVGSRPNLIVGHSLCEVAMESNAKAIFALSAHGNTLNAISSFRPACPVYLITPDETTARQLSMTWGVYPIVVKKSEVASDMIREGIEIAKGCNYIFDGDTIVIGESDTYSKTNLFGVSSSKNIGGIYTV